MDLTDRSVFLFGAFGFLGSWLGQKLHDLGNRISVFVRPNSIQHPLRPKLHKDVKIYEGDIADFKQVKNALDAAAPDMVFNLAAHTDVTRNEDLERVCTEVNFKGAKNVVLALSGGRVKRIVHFGTCEEYGNHEAPFHEEMAPRPVSPYSKSKAKATLWMQDHFKRYGSPIVILRPFLAYGPGQDKKRFLSQAIDHALNHKDLLMTRGEQTREFNHVKDLVDGMVSAITVPGIEGKIFNLACEEERKLSDTARLVYDLCASKGKPVLGAIEYREGEAMRFFGSADKCRKELNYVPKIDFLDGLKELIGLEATQ